MKRKLDNVAKLFSLDHKKDANIFRYSIILKETINEKVLKNALNVTIKYFKDFKVKLSKGFFWNYLEENDKEIIIKKECDKKSLTKIDNNNSYLFKISYYKNKINLDIYHVLTDGTGAINFFKSILYNYLNIKYKLSYYKNNKEISIKDEFLDNYNKKYKDKFRFKKAYVLPQKEFNINNTCHYIINLDKVKRICKYYNVTITEYITALYIYSMYLSLHNKKSKKEIIVSVPINLRKYYKVDTLSNFFSSMNINPGIIKNKLKTFKEVLDNVNKEFKEKLNTTKIKQYLSRDVKTGTNFGIDIIPLNIKKFIMKKFENLIYTNATSTISNVGVIDIDNNYKKFIDNIFVITKPWKMQKIKCSICSYEKKLNITINSNIKDEIFHQTFYNLLKKDIKNIKCISNITNNIY